MLFSSMNADEQARLIMTTACQHSPEDRAAMVGLYVSTHADAANPTEGAEFARQLILAVEAYLNSLRSENDKAVYECRQCGDLYIRARHDQAFCSKRCRTTFHYYRQQKSRETSSAIRAGNEARAKAAVIEHDM